MGRYCPFPGLLPPPPSLPGGLTAPEGDLASSGAGRGAAVIVSEPALEIPHRRGSSLLTTMLVVEPLSRGYPW